MMNEHHATDEIPAHAPQGLYPETADIETSSDEYARRFGGPAGKWMLSVQEKLTLKLMASTPQTPVLDVGGGHGQLAIPLCREGYPVTVLGSHESCRHRIREIAESGSCTFVVGNVIDLPFEDQSFDTVIAFRMLTHCSQWPVLIRELCRVARRSVIVDYPTGQSLNAVAPMLFGAKKKIETDTRVWRLFKHREVRDEFGRHGFDFRRQQKQFFLPMVLHRMLKNRALSAGLEGICRYIGLTPIWGSPVIAHFQRYDAT